LGDQPTALEAAILLDGLREIKGDLSDGFVVREAKERQQQGQLRQQVQGCLERLSKPLLIPYKSAEFASLEFSISIATRLRSYARFSMMFDFSAAGAMAVNCLKQAKDWLGKPHRLVMEGTCP
jgi:hypothetical protein